MGKVHDFSASLKKGKRGEITLLRTYSGLKMLDGRHSDFRIIKTGKGMEVKTESRIIETTPNIFIEVWSKEGKRGGPEQAKKHSELYAHWFVHSRILFIYKCRELAQFINNYVKGKHLVPVKNGHYTTYGIAVNRNLLSQFEIAPSEVGLIINA